MLHQSKIDLSQDQRKNSIKFLQVALSSMIDLSLHTKQAHWNVKGMHFFSLHELFEKFSTKLYDLNDMTAERITALGGNALGDHITIKSNTLLSLYPSDMSSGKSHLETLSTSTAIIAKYVREAISKTADHHDHGTSDLFTELSREMDYFLWLLESHLQ